MAIEQRDVEAILADLRAARTRRDADEARAALRRAPPDEVVAVLDALGTDELAGVLALLGEEQLAEALEYAPPTSAAHLLAKLSRAQAADVLEEMAPDHATDVVDELPDREAEAILTEMEAPEAEAIRELMTYPADTAGGRMTPEFVALRLDMTVDEALAELRRLAEEAETIYYAYVTDPERTLIGVLNLRDLVRARPGTPITAVMVPDPARVRADADQEAAARLLSERGFLAVPVVDDRDRLIGIITADDVPDILQEETTEDIERLGGSQPLEQPYMTASPLLLARKRVGWLLLLFVAEAYTGSVLRAFEAELQAVVALTFFIPLLIGTGGNTGSQTVTTVIRAMAVGEVGFGDVFRVWRKEVTTGLALGAVLAVASYARAWTLGVSPDIGLTVAITAAAVVVWAATVAGLLPLVLRRLNIDPAVVSAPLITTLVDGTGLVIYFEIARRVLHLA